MAQLNSRGTQTRNRWDFYEQSDAFAFVSAAVSSGPIGVYFANNSTGAAMLDIYSLVWSASASSVFELLFLLPPLVAAPLTIGDSDIRPLNALSAIPPGVVGAFTSFSSQYWGIVRYSAGSTGDKLAPIMASYFVTLQPGWALAVQSSANSGVCELSMTVWYQEVLDNVAPAR